MTNQLDMIWTALFILHRENPADENQPIWASPISCTVTSNDGGEVHITRELVEQNAVTYAAEQIGEDPANLQLVGVDWVQMPYVDASEMDITPPAP